MNPGQSTGLAKPSQGGRAIHGVYLQAGIVLYHQPLKGNAAVPALGTLATAGLVIMPALLFIFFVQE